MYVCSHLGTYIFWYLYDKNNRLLSRTNFDDDGIIDTINYEYDDNGNLLFEKDEDDVVTKAYTYDSDNRLIGMTQGNTTASYTYDTSGRRSSKTVNGVVTNHIWDGDRIVYETKGNGNSKAVYYWGRDIIAQRTNSVTEYYLYDEKNTIIGGVNLTDTAKYSAFGERRTADPFVYNPFGYTGEYTDKESGLIYLRNRYYDPSLGRFITEDPAKDGLNWYAYCENNPVMFVDRTGLYADGDKNLPYEIQLILNGNDRKTGGLTAAWNAANERGDQAAMDRIATIATNVRGFSVTNVNRVMVLVQTAGASGLGHTAVLLLNENDQGLLLSYHPCPDGSPMTEPGEMRIAYLNVAEWNNALYGPEDRNVNLVGSTGYNRRESFNGSLYLSVDATNGRNGLAKLAEKFANPGNYNVTTNNCDYQTAAIVMAAGKYYDKYSSPNDSFTYTTMYHTNYRVWLFQQAFRKVEY